MPIPGVPNLQAYWRALGKGYVFISEDPEAGEWDPLGYTEGEITVNFNEEFNILRFPEATGPGQHAAKLQGEDPQIEIPLVIGNPALWDQLTSHGGRGGGFSAPQDPLEFAIGIIPERELAAGLSYEGSWVPAAPQMAFWGWRAYFQRPTLSFRQEEGGKSITTVTASLLVDTTKPEGMWLYHIGDPVAAGFTAFSILAAGS